jgi:hypothetical protein
MRANATREAAEVLSAVAYFAGLDGTALEGLAQAAIRRQYDSGQVVSWRVRPALGCISSRRAVSAKSRASGGKTFSRLCPVLHKVVCTTRKLLNARFVLDVALLQPARIKINL